jgi:hypothetical protein
MIYSKQTMGALVAKQPRLALFLEPKTLLAVS